MFGDAVVKQSDQYFQWINGKPERSEREFDVIDPSEGVAFASCPDASQEQLDRAVSSARHAQAAWRDAGFVERRRFLHAFADELAAQAEPLAALLTREQGKPIARALEEIQRSAGLLRALSALEVPTEVVRDDERGRVELRWRPLGVVGAITPWNVPIVLAISKIVQALYVGNTIVVKPSPYTPLTTLAMGEIANRVFPAGVLNVIAGGADCGRWMTEHPGIEKISFTGSVRTGKHVMASCASTLKRVTLELGGNDAAIVLGDVEPRAIAQQIFWAAFNNSGQVCMAIKRLYVHDSIYEEMVQALAEIAKSVVIGKGSDPSVTLGPLQNRMQYDIVMEILADARRQGARFVTGGHALDRPGNFIEPTILADVAEGVRVVDEEPFGPVLPVIRYTDLDDVIRRANATTFGLGSSVWSKDIKLAADVAGRLEAGTTWVNNHLSVEPGVPFGGIKQSGIGVEYSTLGLKAYLDVHVVKIPPIPVAV